ncbi:ANO9 protein, partial [Upupa epops]|nr:ANO9 protein [Upupa epops]
ATVFLELWKRKRAAVVSEWDLYTWDQDEEELSLQLIKDPQHSPQLYEHSYVRSTAVLLLALLMVVVLIGITHALVIYRVVATAVLTQSGVELLSRHANLAAVVTGAVLHYLTILIMSRVNKRAALFLCDLEKPRTPNLRENNFTVKFFIFQFLTHFSSLIYVAFFLGRRQGTAPLSSPAPSQCHPSGCITDLFIQMAIIMSLKQTISSIMEYLIPWVKHKKRERRQRLQERGLLAEEPEDPCKEHWLSNYELNKVNKFSLFKEFLEMVIQYSFTTIFVAAFPLAPLLAFLNNVVETHLDAFKMARLQQRMVPRKAKDIGIWLQILEAIGILAVIGNGLVIAITSDFIPMQVYKYAYSPCRLLNSTGLDCLTGYVNHSLSVFHTRDFELHTKLLDMGNITECRGWGSRRSPPSGPDRLPTVAGSLCAPQHVALCVKLVAAWYIPDIPQFVKNRVLRSKHRRLQEKL